jgi:hypothetical protein
MRTAPLRLLPLLLLATAVCAATPRETEAAVQRGLRFLAREQDPAGWWDAAATRIRCQDQPTRTSPDDRVALTAQATLALLAGGYDHRTPNPHRTRTARALAWLQSQQDGAGRWSPDGVAHAEAAQALAEAYGMTADPALREPTQRAITALLRMPPPGDAPGMAALAEALAAARAAGFETSNTLELRAGEDEPEVGALLAALHRDISLEAWARRIVQRRLDQRQAVDLRRARLASSALIRLGGPLWERWNPALRDALVEAQATDGARDGSWGDPGAGHPHAGRGRLQATADALLTLMVYYRSAADR